MASAKNQTRKAARSPGTLGPELARLLSKQGLRQKDVAEQAGMSPAQICNFLQGQQDVHASTFVEMLKILGIDIVKLIRAEAGLESDLESAGRSLHLLPAVERNTLVDFLKVFRDRCGDDLRRERIPG